MLDAIGRALVRMLVTRRRLLEWVTADRAENGQRRVDRRAADVAGAGGRAGDRGRWSRSSRPTGCCSRARSSSSGSSRRRSSTSRGCRWRIATSRSGRTERAQFREVARRTWRFFEELVGPADHWLIPDNYQEDRQDVIAHRTSPTNIGLQLLATLAARDLGYISYAGVLDRLEPTFDTLLRMQRYRGHFYNWYDTQTLAPLVPAYISTVDSGNLAGYLLTLRSGLASLAESAPLIDGSVLEGIDDAIHLFEAEVDGLKQRPRHERPEARARQPAHAPGPPAGDPPRVAAAARRSSKNGCRPSASSSTTSRSRSSIAAARRARRCRRRWPKPRRGSNVPPPSSRRGSSSSNGSPAG